MIEITDYLMPLLLLLFVYISESTSDFNKILWKVGPWAKEGTD